MATILHVDADPTSALQLASSLTAAGHSSVRAPGIVEALQLLAHGGIDVVVADSEAPGLTGFELAELALARGYDVPVIVLTSDDRAEHALQALAAGAADCLAKPLVAGALDVALVRAFDLGRLRREKVELLDELARLRDARATAGRTDAARHAARDMDGRVAAPRRPLAGPGSSWTMLSTEVANEFAAEPAAAPEPLVSLYTLDVGEAEARLIEKALDVCRGNRTRAAQLLGISVRTLRNKLNGTKKDAA